MGEQNALAWTANTVGLTKQVGSSMYRYRDIQHTLAQVSAVKGELRRSLRTDYNLESSA